MLYTLDQCEALLVLKSGPNPPPPLITPNDGTLGLPKHVGEETVYQMFLLLSAWKVC